MVTEDLKKATYIDMVRLRHDWWQARGYEYIYWSDFDYSCLKYILVGKQFAKVTRTYNDIIIMADTETSKNDDPESIDNHIVVWTLSARAYGVNLFTLYGRTPTEFCDCLYMLQSGMAGQYTLIYFHNLSYDYVFLRKFLFKSFGYPQRQLNTKPHYPVSLEFANGLIIRDSLILAQRSLEKWSADMDIEHKKAVGYWDYSRIRDQDTPLTNDELHYIEYDTLAGVECLDALRLQLHKNIWTMPYTATGIVREEVRKIGKKNRAKEKFLSAAPTFELYQMLERVYHGGYTHANRHELNFVNRATCYDFASEYPSVMLCEKYPCEKFMRLDDCSPADILKSSDNYAYMFKLVLIEPELKNDDIAMPALQLSKCTERVNAITDNGRILKATYIETYITEQDLAVIIEEYSYRAAYCVEVYCAEKDYLPRWLTDYIYQLFADKTLLKGGDPVAYALAKAKLNSIYGMTVQKWLRDDLHEDFETGEYFAADQDVREEFKKYVDNKNNILLYQIGVWVTAYAFRNIFRLGACVAGQWLYSDTDSCYADEWDMKKLAAYNNEVTAKMLRNGYSAVIFNDREYWPGVAELDGSYSEFVSCGAKRYACRDDKGKLKITVAGVPKSGVRCLKDDIKNFKKGMIFDGLTTGKLTHTYNFVDDIFIDKNNNEVGDSIDLTPCDYLLDSIYKVDWQYLEYEEINIQYYG